MSGREDLAGLVARLRARTDGYTGDIVYQDRLCQAAADAIETLAAENARLAASEPQCAVVKPLVWEDDPDQSKGLTSADGYDIWGFDDGPCLVFPSGRNVSFDTIVAAKAAAQADHNARNPSAITLRTESEVRAEAWAAAMDAVAAWMIEHTTPCFMAVCDIRDITPPADISAALDRIKAEAKAEGMQQVADVRTWPHYPIVMPLKDGSGPASDAECDTITWEVWDKLLNTHGSFDNLPDAINDAMRLNNAIPEAQK